MSSLPTSQDAKVNTSGGDRRAQERGRASLRVATDNCPRAGQGSAPSSVSLPVKWVFGLQPIRPLLALLLWARGERWCTRDSHRLDLLHFSGPWWSLAYHLIQWHSSHTHDLFIPGSWKTMHDAKYLVLKISFNSNSMPTNCSLLLFTLWGWRKWFQSQGLSNTTQYFIMRGALYWAHSCPLPTAPCTVHYQHCSMRLRINIP